MNFMHLLFIAMVPAPVIKFRILLCFLISTPCNDVHNGVSTVIFGSRMSMRLCS
ncbi:hypothetical protein M758_5G155400 [Ceratodon purpureus]|nr:hypothetical protein M758_5G155400 [Ceratodon purpureus]